MSVPNTATTPGKPESETPKVGPTELKPAMPVKENAPEATPIK